MIENLSESAHLPTIRNEGKLYSATGKGKIPWVSADDIAAVTYRALVDKQSHNCDQVVLGNELLSYGDVGCFSTTISPFINIGILPRLHIEADSL